MMPLADRFVHVYVPVDDALADGAAKCRALARETMGEVRDRMGFDRVQ